jgi:formylglycine-generating enzyme required for sulfatase activity
MNNRFSVVDREVPYLHEKQIERESHQLLEEYEIKFGHKATVPIPIEKITEIQLQLTLEFKDMKSLFPFADVHGAIWFEEGIVGIDQSLDPDVNPPMLGRYHFTLAHEIGHWCLHRRLYKDNPNQMRLFDDGTRQPDVVCRSSERKKPVEWQADAFSASLLMPRSMVYQAWMEYHDGDDQEAEMATLRPAYSPGSPASPTILPLNIPTDINDARLITGLVYVGANRPATGVSWNEAARYVNWLNTSQGYSPAYKFATQPGDVGYSSNANLSLWTPMDPGYLASNQFRNSQAKYFLPSMDEWYKAAYYDPNANGGTGGYWDFPTGSDAVPTAVSGGTAPGTAVYNQPINQGPADITSAGGLSPYLVMGMGGNVFEWTETEIDLVNDNPSSLRGMRGGHWVSVSGSLSASIRNLDPPTSENNDIGFRVASIPEPSSAVLLMLASVGLWQRRKRSS